MIRVILATGEFFEIKADALVVDQDRAFLEGRGQQLGVFRLESISRIEFVDGFRSSMEKTQAKSPKAWARWTDEDDIRLAARFNEGATLSQLAEEFERTRGALRSRLLKKGIVGEAWFILHSGDEQPTQAEEVGGLPGTSRTASESAKSEPDPWTGAPPPF